MKTAAQTIVELGHCQDEAATTKHRIELYRALASTTNDPAIAQHFHLCAGNLATAERECAQLHLNFRARSNRKPQS